MELGNKNIKPGRKRVAVDELKRNFSVTFYLSKEEHDVLRRLADEISRKRQFFCQTPHFKNNHLQKRH